VRASFIESCRQRWAVAPSSACLRLYVAGSVLTIAYADLEAECARALTRFDRGRPGETTLVLLPHSAELFLLQIGLVLHGRCPAILPWPTTRTDPCKYLGNLSTQIRDLPVDRLITIPELAHSLDGVLPYAVESCPLSAGADAGAMFSKLGSASTHAARPEPGHAASLPRDTLFLQFTGGTTGDQKCVMVTAQMLNAQMEQLKDAVAVAGDDGVVSWLPLYHDMGLIACLWFPLWCVIPSLHIAPGDWIQRPELLFQFIEEYRGTLCWQPNFAFSYLAQRRGALRRSFALGSMRQWVNCSEPIRPGSIAAFADGYADWGVTRRQLHASYAMAENVFAISHTPADAGPRTISVGEAVCVSSGRVLDGVQVRVCRPDGEPCPEAEAGEIQVRGPSLFQGYWSRNGIRTDVFTSDGWYRTGDYGLLADSELYVMGRLKDIIIVGGQNIYPEDLETVSSAVDGVYPGRVAAFGVFDEERGTESIAIVAEMAGDYDAKGAAALDLEIRKTVVAAITIAPRWVAVVPQRWIIKSTAGKISRTETRRKFLEEWRR
jgi:fatty-acyl-CoA synthase